MKLKRLLVEAVLDKAAFKELVEGKWRRPAVATTMDHLKSRRISERRTCLLTGFCRTVVWYLLKERDDAALRTRLRFQAERYPRYGYPTPQHDMLRRKGLVQDPRRACRICREE